MDAKGPESPASVVWTQEDDPNWTTYRTCSLTYCTARWLLAETAHTVLIEEAQTVYRLEESFSGPGAVGELAALSSTGEWEYMLHYATLRSGDAIMMRCRNVQETWDRDS